MKNIKILLILRDKTFMEKIFSLHLRDISTHSC